VADLRDLVVRRLIELGHDGKPLAYKPAGMRSGGRVSGETIRQIVTGQHSGRLSDEKIEGLAMALSVPVGVIYEAAKVPRPGTRWRWPERFDRLPDEDRRLVEAMASRLLALLERSERGA
jgi:hypothetical protein